jgi:hypothetical protein
MLIWGKKSSVQKPHLKLKEKEKINILIKKNNNTLFNLMR